MDTMIQFRAHDASLIQFPFNFNLMNKDEKEGAERQRLTDKYIYLERESSGQSEKKRQWGWSGGITKTKST